MKQGRHHIGASKGIVWCGSCVPYMTSHAATCVQILGRRTKNNPCLIGEPGVGKTAVAEGLAQKIAVGDVPETIEGKQVRWFLLMKLAARNAGICSLLIVRLFPRVVEVVCQVMAFIFGPFSGGHLGHGAAGGRHQVPWRV